jgi:type I restriction enzyme S subunit
MAEPPLQLDPEHLKIVRELLRKHVPDREVWAFGSRVGGEVKPYSDLDLALLGDAPLPLSLLGRLRDDLSDSALPFRVDLVDWATTDAPFREIIRSRQVIVQRASTEPSTSP